MCTFTCNSHDGSGHTVLGGRAVFLVCCVFILRPFCLLKFYQSSRKVFVPTIFVLTERSVRDVSEVLFSG